MDPEKHTVKVRYPERDNMESKHLKVIVPHTFKNKQYSLPKIDEQVVCLLLQTGQEEGFVIGATYNDKDVVPIIDEDVHMVEFVDGTKVKYSTKTNTLDILVKGNVNIKATGEVKIESFAAL